MVRTALQPDEIAAFRLRAAAVATTLFARRGYDAMTMRAVADALGVSPMTPYRYLAGKTELFALVRAHAFRAFADHLDDAAAAADPIERLRRLKARYLRFALDHPDAYRIMFELRQPDHVESSHEAKRAFGCVLGAVTHAIDAGALEGDPLTVAQLLWASTHGLVSLHLAGRLPARALEQLAAIDHELAGFRPHDVRGPRLAPRPRGSSRAAASTRPGRRS